MCMYNDGKQKRNIEERKQNKTSCTTAERSIVAKSVRTRLRVSLPIRSVGGVHDVRECDREREREEKWGKRKRER